MKTKPSKCVFLGIKVINGTYSAFDPDIFIDGQVINYVGSTPIKFLGHWIYVDLGLNKVKQLVRDKLMSLLLVVDESGINGVSKCWI